jgi:hypothetical protein
MHSLCPKTYTCMLNCKIVIDMCIFVCIGIRSRYTLITFSKKKSLKFHCLCYQFGIAKFTLILVRSMENEIYSQVKVVKINFMKSKCEI